MTPRPAAAVPSWQQAIRDRCFHPSGAFTAFPVEAIEQAIPGRFAQQVAAHPERLAVKDGERQLTYMQLDQAANRVALALLDALGEAAEPVPLFLPHGADTIVGILGVLKAGKFFVSLDPGQPVASSAGIVADLGARGVVSLSSLRADAAGAAGTARVIDLDAIDPTAPSHDPRRDLTPDTLAYVMYTSGTTGPPKGSLETHRNLLHLVWAFVNNFHPGSADRLTMLFRGCFNGSLYDTFGALLNGAALLFYDVRRDGIGGLADWMVAEEVTMYGSVPTVFRALTASVAGAGRFPHVRVVRLLGDRVLKGDVDAFRRVFPSRSVMRVGYGCTETKIATDLLMDATTVLPGEDVPIGYVVEDMSVLLLDEDGRVQERDAHGAIAQGEIAVGSRYLSLGYWRRPDLERAVFLPDPAGGPERIYRTGDLGRMAPDGALTHLGRKDLQARVRGHRVEIAAVEAALLRHDRVAEAAVVSRGDRLVAYVTPHAVEGRPPMASPGELRRMLSQSLPDFMVPSAVVVLEALPVTAAGKIDRAALPDPGRARPPMRRPLVAPRTPVEAVLARIWADVLDLDTVGVEDDFLDLGGHSLSAGLIVQRVVRSLEVDVPMPALMEAPTVAAMALVVVERCAAQLGPDVLARFLREGTGDGSSARG